MRVIAGTHRGRRLLGPVGRVTTRPITDRVKQSLFDKLWSHGALDGGTGLDLYCGTGSLGIEALSRGVDRCIFVESDRSAADLLEKNLDALQLSEKAVVLRCDAASPGWLRRITDTDIELVFCDPPYAIHSDPRGTIKLAHTLEKIADVVQSGAVLIYRTPEKTPPVEIAGWQQPKTFRYGSMAVHWYEKMPGPPEPGPSVRDDRA